MKNLFKSLLLLGLALAATSCLTFEENYTFNEDGSGKMALMLDLSQIAAFVPEGPERDSLFLMKEIFTEMEAEISDLDGISVVEVVEDRDNLRLGIRYAFSDLESLNNALNTMLVAESVSDNHAFFAEEGKAIVRTNLPSSEGITLVEGMAQGLMAEMGGEEEQASYLLESMNYKLNLEFPSRVKVVYAEAEVEVDEENRRQVSLTTNFSSIMSDRGELSGAFVLK